MTVTLTPLAVQPAPSVNHQGDERDPRCTTERCRMAATHVRITAPVPPAFNYREPVAEIVCAVHAGLMPAVGDTVADGAGTLGLVVTHHFPDWRDHPQVSVEWDAVGLGITTVEVADLHHGHGHCRECGDATAPSFDACDRHGGRSPL